MTVICVVEQHVNVMLAINIILLYHSSEILQVILEGIRCMNMQMFSML